MFVTYFTLPFTLAAKKNINVVSTTSEHGFISTGKQCTNLNVDENIFQTINECHNAVGHLGRDKTWHEVSRCQVFVSHMIVERF